MNVFIKSNLKNEMFKAKYVDLRFSNTIKIETILKNSSVIIADLLIQ